MVAILTPETLGPIPTGKDGYREATKVIASLVGHETLHAARSVREKQVKQALRYVNQQADLGLDTADEALIGLMNVGLSETRRFGSEPTMETVKGENPTTHEYQAVMLNERAFRDVASRLSDRRRTDRIDFNAAPEHRYHWALTRQLTNLGILVHDGGEGLGEFSTVAQRLAENANIEEDPMAERKVYAHLLGLAIQAVAKGKPHDYYTEVDRLRAAVNLSSESGTSRGVPKTAAELEQFLTPPPVLTAEQQQQHDFWMAIWDMAEGYDNPMHAQWTSLGANIPLIRQQIKSIDHVQGTRHLIRMARRGEVTELAPVDAEGKPIVRDMAHLADRRNAGNYAYVEGEAGGLFEKLATPPHLIEQELAQVQAGLIYDTARDMADVSPATPLGYHLLNHSAVLDGVQLPEIPANLTPGLRKQAPGRVSGLYERARDAVLRGEFTPMMVPSEKGGMRSQLLAVDGLSFEQHAQLYGNHGIAR